MMGFLVIAHDRTDDEALARRMVVRERRLAAARRTIRSGNVLFGGATLGDEGRTVGSTTVVSFPARAAFAERPRNAPRNKNGVRESVEVHPYHVAVMADSGNGREKGVDGRRDQTTKKGM
jgi:uncharacterized protein YciI